MLPPLESKVKLIPTTLPPYCVVCSDVVKSIESRGACNVSVKVIGHVCLEVDHVYDELIYVIFSGLITNRGSEIAYAYNIIYFVQ